MIRLLYLVSCFRPGSTGFGGNFYSMQTVGAAIRSAAPGTELTILSFGNERPQAIGGFDIPHRHYPIRSYADLLASGFLADLRGAPPTHVHSFDILSYYFSRRIARRFGSKLFFTQPGGSNAPYRPFAEDIILFSQENVDHYGAARFPWPPRIHLLPQRAQAIAPAPDRVAAFRRQLPPGLILLRISRIGEHFKRTAIGTMTLAETLRARGIAATAVIVGRVQAQSTHDELVRRAGGRDLVLTDDALTNHAAQLIPAADFVIGTGRSFMEATMSGKPVLAPVVGAPHPILVDRTTLPRFQQANISERVTFPEGELVNLVNQTREKIVRAATEASAYSALCAEARELSRNFDVAEAVPGYLAAYAQPQVGRFSRYDDVMLFKSVVGAVHKGAKAGFNPGLLEQLTGKPG